MDYEENDGGFDGGFGDSNENLEEYAAVFGTDEATVENFLGGEK